MIWRELQECDPKLADGEGNVGLKEGPGPCWGGDGADLGPNKQKGGKRQAFQTEEIAFARVQQCRK